MVSIIQTGALLDASLSPMNSASAVIVCLSSDTKPSGLGVGNGWMAFEMDTKKIYFYDAANAEWREFT